MLQNSRTGDRAVLGDVPDQQNGGASRLRLVDEGCGHLTDLSHVARGAFDLAAGDGLDRVDDEQIGREHLDLSEDGRQVGLGGEGQVGAHAPIRSRAVEPGQRLLSADGEDVAVLARGACGDVE